MYMYMYMYIYIYIYIYYYIMLSGKHLGACEMVGPYLKTCCTSEGSSIAPVGPEQLKKSYANRSMLQQMP